MCSEEANKQIVADSTQSLDNMTEAFIRTKNDNILLTNDPLIAAKDADLVVTDVWASMGQEEEEEDRKKIFR